MLKTRQLWQLREQQDKEVQQYQVNNYSRNNYNRCRNSWIGFLVLLHHLNSIYNLNVNVLSTTLWCRSNCLCFGHP